MNVVIFANGEEPFNKKIIEKIKLLKSDNIILACDGGANICKKMNIVPDYILGDFDSYQKQDSDKSEYIHLHNQDFTDLQKALEFSKRFNPQKITIFSAFGKRFDHTLANLLIFNFEISQHINLEVYDNYGKFYILEAGNHILKKPRGKTISFFSLGKIKNLILNGFEYEFSTKEELPYFIGVSNVIKDDIAKVSFSKGKLIVYELIE